MELDREMEEAAASLGRRLADDLPPRRPPQPRAGHPRRAPRWRFARAVGEFGSLVLIAGNIPFHTQLASVYIFGQVESDDPIGAAAVSVVLLAVSLLVLLAIARPRTLEVAP